MAYQLIAAPTNAVISTNGIITWAASPAQVASTNLFTTVVSENGAPPLSDANSFLVFVQPVPVSLQIQYSPASGVTITWTAPSSSWVLQQADSVDSTNWMSLNSNSVVSSGNQQQTTITNLSQTAFFRLFNQQPQAGPQSAR